MSHGPQHAEKSQVYGCAKKMITLDLQMLSQKQHIIRGFVVVRSMTLFHNTKLERFDDVFRRPEKFNFLIFRFSEPIVFDFKILPYTTYPKRMPDNKFKLILRRFWLCDYRSCQAGHAAGRAWTNKYGDWFFVVKADDGCSMWKRRVPCKPIKYDKCNFFGFELSFCVSLVCASRLLKGRVGKPSTLQTDRPIFVCIYFDSFVWIRRTTKRRTTIDRHVLLNYKKKKVHFPWTQIGRSSGRGQFKNSFVKHKDVQING